MKAYSSEYVFLHRKHISSSARSVFPVKDLFVDKFLQIGPWQSNPYIFLTVAPNQVNPKPMSSFRRARSDGIIVTMF